MKFFDCSCLVRLAATAAVALSIALVLGACAEPHLASETSAESKDEANSRASHPVAAEASISVREREALEILGALRQRGAPVDSSKLIDALQSYAASSDSDPESTEAKELATALAATGLTCEVTFRTETPGATIRYRLIARDAADTAGLPTNDAVETVPIGLYWVWAERASVEKPMRKTRYRLVDVSKTIQVPEPE